MALAGAALIAAGMLFSCTSKAPKSLVTPPNAAAVKAGQAHREPVRGVWLTTVSRLDWPPVGSIIASTPESRITQQKLALIAKLDNLQRLGINTVFFQVKPDGTALWRSDILPWSDMLTGKIGEYPGYDPLQFMLDEAHKRGMKVHAWFNPYRVSVNTKPSTIAELNNTLTQVPASVFVLHRNWIRTASDRFVLDPGIPEARDWITSIVAEVVQNYPIDGVQFDDYFYTETASSPLNDNETFRRYGQGYASKGDWRRHNTQQLIAQVSTTIKKLNPNVEFGVSPAGVWRNRSHDPAGSDTRARPPMMSPMPIPAAGCSRDCSTTSRRRSTGRLPAMPRAMMCWPTGGPRWLNRRIPGCISAWRCTRWVNRPKMSLTGRWTAACRS